MASELPNGKYEIDGTGPGGRTWLHALELMKENKKPRTVRIDTRFKAAWNDPAGSFGVDLEIYLAALMPHDWASSYEVNCWMFQGVMVASYSGRQTEPAQPRLVLGYYDTVVKSGWLYLYPDNQVPVLLTLDGKGRAHWSFEEPVTTLRYPPKFFMLRRTPGSVWRPVTLEKYLEEEATAELPTFPNGLPAQKEFENAELGLAGQWFANELELMRFVQQMGENKVRPPQVAAYFIWMDSSLLGEKWTSVSSKRYLSMQNLDADQLSQFPRRFSHGSRDLKGHVCYTQDDVEEFLTTHKVQPTQQAS